MQGNHSKIALLTGINSHQLPLLHGYSKSDIPTRIKILNDKNIIVFFFLFGVTPRSAPGGPER